MQSAAPAPAPAAKAEEMPAATRRTIVRVSGSSEQADAGVGRAASVEKCGRTAADLGLRA